MGLYCRVLGKKYGRLYSNKPPAILRGNSERLVMPKVTEMQLGAIEGVRERETKKETNIKQCMKTLEENVLCCGSCMHFIFHMKLTRFVLSVLVIVIVK